MRAQHDKSANPQGQLHRLLVLCAVCGLLVVPGCSDGDKKAQAKEPVKKKPPRVEFVATPGGVKELVFLDKPPLTDLALEEIFVLLRDIKSLNERILARDGKVRNMLRRVQKTTEERDDKKKRRMTREERDLQEDEIDAVENRVRILRKEADDLTVTRDEKLHRMRAIVRYALREKGFEAVFEENGDLKGYRPEAGR